MKKYLLIIMILGLTGCSINYNIELEDNKYKETITSEFNYKNLDDEASLSLDGLDEHGIYAFKSNQTIMHNKNIEYKKNKVYIDMNYDYTINDFKDAYLPNTCFDSYIYLNEEDYYYIELKGKFGCMYADKVNISLTTDNMVIDTNGKNKNNKYSWTIEEKNKNDVNIYIKISKISKNENNNVLHGFKIAAGIILIILVIAAVLVYKIIKNKKTL